MDVVKERLKFRWCMCGVNMPSMFLEIKSSTTSAVPRTIVKQRERDRQTTEIVEHIERL